MHVWNLWGSVLAIRLRTTVFEFDTTLIPYRLMNLLADVKNQILVTKRVKARVGVTQRVMVTQGLV